MKKLILIPTILTASLCPIVTLAACNHNNGIALSFEEKLLEYDNDPGFIYRDFNIKVGKQYKFNIKFNLIPDNIFTPYTDSSFGFGADDDKYLPQPDPDKVIVKLNGKTLTKGVDGHFAQEADYIIETQKPSGGGNKTDILSIDIVGKELSPEVDTKFNILFVRPEPFVS